MLIESQRQKDECAIDFSRAFLLGCSACNLCNPISSGFFDHIQQSPRRETGGFVLVSSMHCSGPQTDYCLQTTDN
jgi:hypothetical protein